MSAAPASMIEQEPVRELRRELHVVECHAEVAQQHVADDVTLGAFAHYLWDTKRWWLGALAVVAACNGALLTLTASWPSAGPIGF